ncbi:NUDIX domain-containing protein [Salinisphaera sp. Q1T1-3]|uniref:NUDIX hydrolase n=1 Tax=Salinisphaera sp. Q1T1-3 TaxID=2321229 RepID=UPI00131456A6|nr:NUDIX domain-containing protein [Salinisphaera sp. Q1T1-3]
MIHCACLVIEENDKLLLVRVRDNSHYYFAGGKIEPGESPQAALHREIHEELGTAIAADSVQHLMTVDGPALDSHDTVTLYCFTGRLLDTPTPMAEITALDWIAIADRHRMAPAVQRFCESRYDAA